MKKLLATCLFIILLSPIAHATDTAKPTDISVDELHKMIADNASLVVIDARGANQYKDGHIKGAINLPADKITPESLAKVAPDMNQKLAFYCTDVNCEASRIGAAKALTAGYKYVYEFAGGYTEWSKYGFDTAK